MKRNRIPASERLMRHIRRDNDCWIWTGAKTTSGYGQSMDDNQKTIMAHRLSYQLFKEPITDGLFVLHKCDVPLCVNPDHLFLGTQKDNMTDMTVKNRRATGDSLKLPSQIGEENNAAKTSWDEVKTIREEYQSGSRIKTLCQKHPHLTQSTISLIVNNKRWISNE